MISFFRKLGWLARRSRKEADLREELQFHLEEEAEQHQAEGLDPGQATRAARIDLGNIAFVRENTRATWGWIFFEQLEQDVRYALRTMRANRLFTTLAMISLALGIGANTAIYSFLDAILLRSLPVPDPASLAVLNWRSKVWARHQGNTFEFVMHSMDGSAYDTPHGGMISGIFPFPAFELFQKQSGAVFSSVFAYRSAEHLNVIVKGQAGITNGEYVSGDYFRGLAVVPAAGRPIAADDDRVGAPPVAVLSMKFAQSRFGGPENAAGQPILVNNVPFTVAGVAPPEFFGVDPAAAPDVYLPLHTNLLLEKDDPWGTTEKSYLDANYYWINVMGRLRPGVSLAQAQQALVGPFHQWVSTTASNAQERANLPVLTVKEGAGGLDSLRRRYSQPLYVLWAMVGLILAIACANTASLLLARSAARRREMAVRLSLGAGRGRVMRQLLTESVLLACLGGLLGILFAVWGVHFLTLLLAHGEANFTLHAEVNWPVLTAALLLSVITGVLFGLAPALQSTRVEVMPALRETRAAGEARVTHRAGFLRLNHLLVAGQIAISLLLLVAASLFVRTLSNLHSVQLGFNRENLLLFQLDARRAGHRDPEIAAFYSSLQRRFQTIPGMRGATLSHASLMGASRQLPILVSGSLAPDTRILNIGPEFFSTMQIPILLGREIDERDQPTSPSTVVVNEVFAKTFLGEKNPVGRQIALGGDHPREMTVVGVSANARYGGLKGQIPPVVYMPYNQGGYPPIEQMTYALRTSGDPLRYVKTIREIVHRADSRIALAQVRTQAAEIDHTISQEIVFARLCSGFAILALVIASIGLYGTMSYGVARRTSEIGIRMALGASRSTVVWTVLRPVFAMTAAGLALGLAAALGLSKLVASFLFGIKSDGPWTFATALTILLSAAILAAYLPARKAAQIDPAAALRQE